MFQIITIPFDPVTKGFDADLLNRFALNKQVRSFRAEFFTHGDHICWTVFLEYDPVIPPAADRETDGLDEPGRLLLERLKAWRKQRAEKDGIPAFIIATNREMKDLVVKAPKSLEGLKAVKGFGKGKIGKYGAEIVEMIRVFYEKT